MGKGTSGKNSRILVADQASAFGSISNAKSQGTNVGGANSCTFTAANETLDITDFQDEAMDNIHGLQNPECSIDFNDDGGDAGQSILYDSLTGSLTDNLWIAFLPDENGSRGFEAKMLVESVDPSSDVDGVAGETSASIVPTGGSGYTIIS